MRNKILLVVLLAALPASGSAGYIHAMVANATTGVATWNQSISGNVTWNLTHVDSGAVLAQVGPSAFTNSPGLTATWGASLGNLTGNFSWAVILNVSLGIVNNSSAWQTETGNAGFVVAPPTASPTPTPTAAPPPPPSTGDITLYLSSPGFGVSYHSTLPVIAVARALNNTTIFEVRAVIENAPPRAAPPGETPCDAVPTGWQPGASDSNDSSTYRWQWDLNSSTLPLVPGDYTVYVRAQNSGGKVACDVVPNVPVNVAASGSPAPGASPSPAASLDWSNVTVVATSCPIGAPPTEKPCPQGLLGPVVKGHEFHFTLSMAANVALNGPTDSKVLGIAERNGFLPQFDGTYCLTQVDPASGAILAKKIRISGGGDACWTTQGAFATGYAGVAPGLNVKVEKPDQIPCTPIPGFRHESTGTDASGGVSQEIRTDWVLIPGADKRIVCTGNHPVFWLATVPVNCPAALDVPTIQPLSAAAAASLGGAAAASGTVISTASKLGVVSSRSVTADGSLGPFAASILFPLPTPCLGHYSVSTMDADSNPQTDNWVPAFSFEIINPPGWDEFDLRLIEVGIVVGGVAGFWVTASMRYERPKIKLNIRSIGDSTFRGYDRQHFTPHGLEIPDPETGKPFTPQIVVFRRIYTWPRKKVKRGMKLHDVTVGFAHEFASHTETAAFLGSRVEWFTPFPMYSNPIDFSDLGEKMPHTPDIIVRGRVVCQDERYIERIHTALHDQYSRSYDRQIAREEALRDAIVARQAAVARGAVTGIDTRAQGAAREVAGGLSGKKQPEANLPKEDDYAWPE